MNLKPVFKNLSKLKDGSIHLPRILGRLRSLAFSHIPRYATESKWAKSLQGCDPYGPEILRIWV